MAHKTLIGGTAYEISGGKTLVGGTAYSIKNGKTLIGGTAYEMGFDSWPDDLDTGLKFVSASAFTINVKTHGWDGTMEYCNGDEWKTWDGSEILSGETRGGQCIYIRGVSNTKVAGRSSGAWTLTGTDIECNGNIEKLLDFATVNAGEHPSMAEDCYNYMFYNCTNLTVAPSLPATTLSKGCYRNMFYGCTNLTVAPSLPATTLSDYCYEYMFGSCTNLIAIPILPATTLKNYCYRYMFYGCTNIKLNNAQTTKAYRIPYSGNGRTANNALKDMFYKTGGIISTPSINTTYYLDESNTIV